MFSEIFFSVLPPYFDLETIISQLAKLCESFKFRLLALLILSNSPHTSCPQIRCDYLGICAERR